mgnify:CR=1 FL=1
MGNEEKMSDIMTTSEVAAYLRLSEATIYKLARAGDIPAIQVGKAWRFSRPLLDKWLDRQMRENLAPNEVPGETEE